MFVAHFNDDPNAHAAKGATSVDHSPRTAQLAIAANSDHDLRCFGFMGVRDSGLPRYFGFMGVRYSLLPDVSDSWVSAILPKGESAWMARFGATERAGKPDPFGSSSFGSSQVPNPSGHRCTGLAAVTCRPSSRFLMCSRDAGGSAVSNAANSQCNSCIGDVKRGERQPCERGMTQLVFSTLAAPKN